MNDTLDYILIEIANSGAGVLASLHVGAHAALEDAKYRSDLNIGTSAGAIVAGLESLGMKPADMKNVVISADFAKLIPYDYLDVFEGHLASNANVISWLKELTNNQTMKDCTTRLITVTSDLTTGSIVTFDSSDPTIADMPVWQAIVPSMSIPLIFPPFLDRYEDGGVMDNLAVNYLTGKHPGIGLQITETTKLGPVEGPIDIIERTAGMMLSASENDMTLLAKALSVPIVKLPAGNISFLDRTMPASLKLDLYNRGYDIMSKYLEAHPLTK
jgi:predicted acylesterase/phospholipase RssA